MKCKELHYTDSIHYELEQTAKLMRILTAQLFERLEISISQDEYAALDTISINPGICQRDLAKLIIKDRANTGRILNCLEKNNFVTRLVDIKNNRLVKKLKITQKGIDELNFINTKIKSYLDNITEKISQEEVDRVQEILRGFRLDLEKLVEMKI